MRQTLRIDGWAIEIEIPDGIITENRIVEVTDEMHNDAVRMGLSGAQLIAIAVHAAIPEAFRITVNGQTWEPTSMPSRN